MTSVLHRTKLKAAVGQINGWCYLLLRNKTKYEYTATKLLLPNPKGAFLQTTVILYFPKVRLFWNWCNSKNVVGTFTWKSNSHNSKFSVSYQFLDKVKKHQKFETPNINVLSVINYSVFISSIVNPVNPDLLMRF